MAIKKNLPHVVLRDDEFRLVALETTDQHDSDHKHHIVVNLGSADSPLYIKCVAEVVERDSMGNESWSEFGFNDAARCILRSQIQDVLCKAPVVAKSSPKPKVVKLDTK